MKFDAIVRGRRFGPVTGNSRAHVQYLIWRELSDRPEYRDLKEEEVIVADEPTTRNANR